MRRIKVALLICDARKPGRKWVGFYGMIFQNPLQIQLKWQWIEFTACFRTFAFFPEPRAPARRTGETGLWYESQTSSRKSCESRPTLARPFVEPFTGR